MRKNTANINHPQAGMTLIELAIVILIIGLIAGSIVMTRSVIRSSKIQSILAQSQIYAAAANNFIVEFKSVPGDMPDATNHWASAINGDGNGFINAPNAAFSPGESYQFWLQLQLADLLPINMSGASAGAGVVIVPDVNVPSGKLANSTWFAGYDMGVNIAQSYAVDAENYFILGGAQATGLPIGKLLTPDEAYSIDLKADNGEPATGSIVAIYFNGECSEAESGVNSATNFDARYRVEDATRQCALGLNKAF